jgi:hypothetical protein
MQEAAQGNLDNRKKLFAVFTVAIILAAALGIILTYRRGISSTRDGEITSTTIQYSVNGLTCPYPANTSAEMVSLISKVTTNQRFLAETNGSKFVLGNFQNITDRIQVIGGNRTVSGTTIHLPDVTELDFYSSGASTTCERASGPFLNLDVQVPIQDGQYNVTGMQLSTTQGPFA